MAFIPVLIVLLYISVVFLFYEMLIVEISSDFNKHKEGLSKRCPCPECCVLNSTYK